VRALHRRLPTGAGLAAPPAGRSSWRSRLLVAAQRGLPRHALGSEFVPRLREGSIVVNTVSLAGVSLDETVRYGTQIERAARQLPR
jgi:Cu/Ag efflux pump CusA